MDVNQPVIIGRTMRCFGWIACLCVAILSLSGTALASPPLSKEPLSLRVVQTFFPTLDWRIDVAAPSSAGRSYGGNSEKMPTADRNGPLHVVVISDLNSSYGSTTYRDAVYDAVDEIIRRRPDVVICAGDMVAGQRHGLNYRAMWQGFHDAVTLPLEQAGIPLLVTAGNHDGPHPRRYEYQRRIFKDEWNIHRPKVTFVDDTHYPEYYSVAMGPVFFVSVDSSTVGTLGGDQMPWLEAQLQRAQDYPVKIVFGHVPMWAVSRGRGREIIGDDDLEALLERYDVDAFIAGHDHAYYPGARRGIRYISAPALGTGPRYLLAPDQEHRSPRGFLEFFAGVNGGMYDLESWKVPDFQSVDARESLPAKVGRGRAPLVRDDLQGLDLRSQDFEDATPRNTPSASNAPAQKNLDTHAAQKRSAEHKRPSAQADEPSKRTEERKKERRATPVKRQRNRSRALPADLYRD